MSALDGNLRGLKASQKKALERRLQFEIPGNEVGEATGSADTLQYGLNRFAREARALGELAGPLP